ncbi:MAG: 5-formyltetrahydrofolate cyclo-ligase [Nitrospirae bacterium]|nr:5-formyltetrahydrofolate cyclo-ligase [Magnetococcales bacterium]HAT49579.1 5-formyltetrahydrofolate cyclo-ligase [Alphaproteobacteria bacterium]
MWGDFDQVQPSKEALRRMLRTRRRAMPLAEVARLSGMVCRLAVGLAVYVRASVVGVYHAADHEVDPESLMRHAVSLGKKVALPVTGAGEKGMVFVEWGPERGMAVGPFGIMQPCWTGEIADTVARDDLDVIFVPLVGFDRRGGRIGYGGGYFDRYLAGAPGGKPCLVGLAYGCQEVAEIPAEPHDCRLHYVITEGGVTCFA